MPAPFVKRKVEDMIFYYYAKLIIAPSSSFKGNYRFIIDAYKRLKSGEIRMSDYERELLHIAKNPNKCVFCDAEDHNLQTVHVVPRLYGVPPGMHNLVYACDICAISKGEKDLVDWWCKDLEKARDDIPRVLIGIYLKIAYELHKINFSLKTECKSLGEVFNILEKITNSYV